MTRKAKDDSKQQNEDAGTKDSKLDDAAEKDGDVTPKKKGKKGKKSKEEKEEDKESKTPKGKEGKAGKDGKKEEEKEAKKKVEPKKAAQGVKKKGKGDAPLRVGKKEILYRNSPGLSQLQIDYESKLWPRHYLEEVMNTRMKRFDEIEEEKVAKE